MHVLICDDEPDMQLLLRMSTESLGYRASTVGSARDAEQVCREDTPDVLVLDVTMPDVDGPMLLEKLRASAIAPSETILISAITPGDLARLADDLGVRWLPKPCSYEQYAEALRSMAA